MKNSIKEQVLNEILEHTQDCDYNRSEHFIEKKRYSFWSKVLDIIQMACLICIIIYYMVGMEGLFTNVYIPICLSISATVAQLIAYLSNCTDLAQQHWIAAQAYTRLYRECQFFYTNFSEINNIDILRQKAQDISDEICDLNLMAPELRSSAYNKAKKELNNKNYAIETVIREERIERLSVVVNSLKEVFQKYNIEITAYGSFLNSIQYRDIDIAVIVYSANVEKSKLEEASIAIERQYFELGLNLDITVITERDLSLSSLIPFLNNIKAGQQLFISPMVKESILDKSENKIDYDFHLNHFNDAICASIAKNDKHSFIMNSYYYLYYAIANILSEKGITWYGEDSISKKFLTLSKNNQHYSDMYNLFALLKKEKNSELVVESYDDINIQQLYSRLEAIRKDD